MKIKPGKYKHYKGKYYQVFRVVLHSETLEELVYYKCLHHDPRSKYWVRPLKMFTEKIKIGSQKVPRFKYVGS